METILNIIEVALNFVPVVMIAAPLIALIIDGAKRIGVLKDGYAGLASLALNAAVWIALYVADELGIRVEAEAFVAEVSKFAPVVLALLTALWATPKLHEFFKARGLGYSHTPKRA